MSTLERAGIRYRLHPNVYDPHDDTALLLAHVVARPGERALDLGCGAGLVAIRLAHLGARVVASDLNPWALRLTRENARLNGTRLEAVRADLGRGLRLAAFEVVAFNPPYLPTAPHEHVPGALDGAFDGGPSGRDVLDRFLDAIAEAPPRRAYVVASSLQGPDPVAGPAARRGLAARRLGEKALSHETVTVYEVSTERRAGTKNDGSPRPRRQVLGVPRGVRP